MRVRSAWKSPVRFCSFRRSAPVTAVRARSLLLPGPHPCSRNDHMLSSCHLMQHSTSLKQ